jgi:tetratricopeptide (TPR) repeat protein
MRPFGMSSRSIAVNPHFFQGHYGREARSSSSGRARFRPRRGVEGGPGRRGAQFRERPADPACSPEALSGRGTARHERAARGVPERGPEGGYDAALQDFDSAVRRNPNDPVAQVNGAIVFTSKACYKQSRGVDPRSDLDQAQQAADQALACTAGKSRRSRPRRISLLRGEVEFVPRSLARGRVRRSRPPDDRGAEASSPLLLGEVRPRDRAAEALAAADPGRRSVDGRDRPGDRGRRRGAEEMSGPGGPADPARDLLPAAARALGRDRFDSRPGGGPSGFQPPLEFRPGSSNALANRGLAYVVAADWPQRPAGLEAALRLDPQLAPHFRMPWSKPGSHVRK